MPHPIPGIRASEWRALIDFLKAIEIMVDQIQILLHEYDSLRSEIINRTGFGFQLGAIGLAALALLISQRGLKLWIGLVVGIILFGSGIALNLRAIQKLHVRLERIEKNINVHTGQDLLEWETRWGAGWAIPPEREN
jgi:hypothetical protein